jgi:SAM-dependent methyltransferase
VLSTLTIAHIARADKALAEWRRVLKPGGSLLITDYHPAALAAGARRTFRHRHQTVSIVNHVHAIEKIRAITAQLGLQETCFTESRIDESLRPFYEKQQALAIYDRFYGTPIIYGMRLIKPHVAAAG